MSTKGWHIERAQGVLTLSRQGRARMDVGVQAMFPAVRQAVLAHQIRQDIWRALQRVRGFSPIVRVVEQPVGVLVTAGGQVDARHCKSTVEATITSVLQDPVRQRRWLRWAQ